ncbi:TlpA family protein disulfide reductase [Paenibacillus lignilyticus]|uniref:TlpA family protein disulfide reductase n=1 Tax=Paenibacillus lignilyticus TaxID=1172615 RepID=A0ABS5CKT6_9BACL|nr:TlpA disulfide reductase family protein [Paenibacillus lignilyticus]MBP3966480.1 TlpA family protein disulfide reductase [Paenibacillus lignilyticus]
MKRSVLLWGTLLVVMMIAAAVYVTGHYSLSDAEAGVAPPTAKATEDRASEFTLEDLNGNHVSLRELRGHNVYINFWASWCKYCKKEMPDMKKIYERYQEKDLIILTVNVGENREKAAAYLQDNGYPFRAVLDPDKKIAMKYGITSIPVSVFVDRKGNIVQKRVGAMKEAEMRAILDPMINS